MSERETVPYPPRLRAWATVAVLMTAYVFSFIDRQVLGLLVEPISHDLKLSDTEFSLLQGLSFAVFYTVCGIPLARIADTGSRRCLIAAGVAFWSLMTAACGRAQGYAQLLALRMGVGVGEATLSPAAYSMIVDSFPPARRATALGVYTMGIYIGSGLAFLLGGLVIGYASMRTALIVPLLGAVRPWQYVFLLLGAAGLVFSLAVLALREPARQRSGVGAAPVAKIWFGANRATLAHHHLGFALMSFASYGAAAWAPSVFIRVHGWSAARTGVVYGLAIGIFGALGSLGGGRLADRLAARGVEDAALRVGYWGALAALPFTLLWPLLSDPWLGAALMALALFCIAVPFGVAPAAIQAVMPNALRARASAVYLFVVNLIGLGIGPTAVALLTDRVFHDRQAVAVSLVIVSVLAEVGAILLLRRGLPHYRASVRRLQALEADQ